MYRYYYLRFNKEVDKTADRCQEEIICLLENKGQREGGQSTANVVSRSDFRIDTRASWDFKWQLGTVEMGEGIIEREIQAYKREAQLYFALNFQVSTLEGVATKRVLLCLGNRGCPLTEQQGTNGWRSQRLYFL